MGPLHWSFPYIRPLKPVYRRWIKWAFWLYVGQALFGAVVGLIIGTCIGLKVDTCLGFDLQEVTRWLNL